MSEKTHSLSLYLAVYIALLLLLALTVGMSFVDLGGARNSVVAIVIASLKCLLIVLFFMHIRYQPWITWLFAAAGFLWLTIMISLTLTDYLTRNHPADSSPKGEPAFLSSHVAMTNQHSQ
jgi:cytochrome c oxidase subunit 4